MFAAQVCFESRFEQTALPGLFVVAWLPWNTRCIIAGRYQAEPVQQMCARYDGTHGRGCVSDAWRMFVQPATSLESK